MAIKADPIQDERAEALQEMLTSDGWLFAAVPGLKARKADLERQLAMGEALELPELRRLQGAWRVVDELLRQPRRFFDFRGES